MKKNPWPYAICAYFAVFITGIAAWVTFALRNDDQLVRADYYEHEITFQKQIDRVARTRALETGARAIYDHHAQTLTLLLPEPPSTNALTGEIHFYRPSDVELDQKIALNVDAHFKQTLSVSDLKDGLWKVNVIWTDGTQEYYFEELLVLSKG